MNFRILYLAMVALAAMMILGSCSSSKSNLAYFRDITSETEVVPLPAAEPVKIAPDDELFITVTSTEMLEAFEEPVERILEAVHGVLERTPPELVADISNNGIVMTGGGSLVDGFDRLIEARTGIHTVVAEDAISCVAEGTGKSLDSLNSMTDGTVNLSRRRQMN